SQERARFAEQSVQLAQRTLEAISARVEAARSPEAERSRARIALTRAQVEQAQARSELATARYALVALWGDEQPTFASGQANLFSFPPLRDFESLLAGLESNPDFVRFASEARLRDAEVRLAQAQARPDITFSLGVRRFEETSDTALVGGFSIGLPVFNRNRGAIREAQVRRAQSEVEREAAFARARAALFGLFQEVGAARLRSDTLRSEAIPQAQTALEQTQYGYDRGRFSYLELVTAQQELLALQEAAIDAAADHHRLRAEIERLTSEPLTDALELPLP
ncbi:MAG: TolC family protein, partial [Steroidobacter sp.]